MWYELTQAEHVGQAVKRLNHSATLFASYHMKLLFDQK